MNRAGDRHASAGAQATVAEALKVLARGGVVGYPSETVWGLAALPSSAAGVERLYTLKQRDSFKPVQLSCASAEVAHSWIRPGQPEFERLARLWPGPLTLLAWAVPGCPERLAPGGVVGLRVPAHPLALALLAEAGEHWRPPASIPVDSLRPPRGSRPRRTSWPNCCCQTTARKVRPVPGRPARSTICGVARS
ncbi:Sua5/YciO/YrdC/YwlC family protein [Deinococcus sp. KNUC1210]|uniref:L-threonylcarbamoyladenylate synthase n=1 Tax=Deinococcus sp. KNUC1210 TaxID=2917691 RepID=UPI001EF05C6F|nr:Sua5/YciO/YrdC/YwlC family protein [Deinococcus sp. KNUC1210]ULH15350.1 Sua5/YciO/YrdC/YwlC family protein [Deinococcus sp. KNUC1210]